jgi:hypothetical protein
VQGLAVLWVCGVLWSRRRDTTVDWGLNGEHHTMPVPMVAFRLLRIQITQNERSKVTIPKGVDILGMSTGTCALNESAY